MASEQLTLKTPLGHEYTLPGPWKSLDAIKRANTAAGKVFFDRDKGPALDDIRQGRFLLTADRDFFDERVYHLNAALDDGSIDQVGDVLGYRTVAAADAALVAIALGRPELTDVEIETGPRSRPSGLTADPAPELDEARLAEEWELERSERALCSMIEDPTSDLYYSDGARVMRQDAGLEH